MSVFTGVSTSILFFLMIKLQKSVPKWHRWFFKNYRFPPFFERGEQSPEGALLCLFENIRRTPGYFATFRLYFLSIWVIFWNIKKVNLEWTKSSWWSYLPQELSVCCAVDFFFKLRRALYAQNQTRFLMPQRFSNWMKKFMATVRKKMGL